jgi:hypothetical protein
VVQLHVLQEAIKTKTITPHMKSSLIGELDRFVKQFQGMSDMNPEEWRHRLLFLMVRMVEEGGGKDHNFKECRT